MSTLHIKNLVFNDRGPYSFSIRAEEILCIYGKSGAGKSLLLRSIADLDHHDGEIYLDSIECTSIPANEWRQIVRYIPAESYWWYDTVGEHFRADIDSIKSMLHSFGFDCDVFNWPVHRLSTGEKQRLALVRSLADTPKALLLDEPTASLDKANVFIAEKIITEYIKLNSAPALWVSHDNDQISRLSNYKAEILTGGKMRFDK